MADAPPAPAGGPPSDAPPTDAPPADQDAEPETFVGPDGAVRVRGVEFVFPIVIGSCAFALGKKATDTETHRWTLYVRGATPEEDVGDVVAKVVFNLHPTFHNPRRELTATPFELTEAGWGEFELTADVHFVESAGEPPVELMHKLRLYSDADPQGLNQKKPVVAEAYEEIVFSEPRLEFWKAVRARSRPPLATPLSVAPHCLTFTPADDARRITLARQRVAQVKASLLRQLDALGAGGGSEPPTPGGSYAAPPVGAGPDVGYGAGAPGMAPLGAAPAAPMATGGYGVG